MRELQTLSLISWQLLPAIPDLDVAPQRRRREAKTSKRLTATRNERVEAATFGGAAVEVGLHIAAEEGVDQQLSNLKRVAQLGVAAERLQAGDEAVEIGVADVVGCAEV